MFEVVVLDDFVLFCKRDVVDDVVIFVCVRDACHGVVPFVLLLDEFDSILFYHWVWDMVETEQY